MVGMLGLWGSPRDKTTRQGGIPGVTYQALSSLPVTSHWSTEPHRKRDMWEPETEPGRSRSICLRSEDACTGNAKPSAPRFSLWEFDVRNPSHIRHCARTLMRSLAAVVCTDARALVMVGRVDPFRLPRSVHRAPAHNVLVSSVMKLIFSLYSSKRFNESTRTAC